MLLQSYLFFEGRCDEAIAFYRQALNAQVEMLMRYNESPEPPKPGQLPPGSENKVMHASLRIGDCVLMCSDGMCGGAPRFEGFSLSLTAKSVDEAKQLFANLSEGGQVHQPIIETFFSPAFGMLIDRFGVNWMVLVHR